MSLVLDTFIVTVSAVFSLLAMVGLYTVMDDVSAWWRRRKLHKNQ